LAIRAGFLDLRNGSEKPAILRLAAYIAAAYTLTIRRIRSFRSYIDLQEQMEKESVNRRWLRRDTGRTKIFLHDDTKASATYGINRWTLPYRHGRPVLLTKGVVPQAVPGKKPSVILSETTTRTCVGPFASSGA